MNKMTPIQPEYYELKKGETPLIRLSNILGDMITLGGDPDLTSVKIHIHYLLKAEKQWALDVFVVGTNHGIDIADGLNGEPTCNAPDFPTYYSQFESPSSGKGEGSEAENHLMKKIDDAFEYWNKFDGEKQQGIAYGINLIREFIKHEQQNQSSNP